MPDHFRRWARVPVRLRVTVRRQFDRGAAEVPGLIENLSLGGAFVRVEKIIPPDTRVVIGVSSANTWDPLRLPATVRWVREARSPGLPVGIGVEFDPLSRDGSLALYKLFSSKETDAG